MDFVAAAVLAIVTCLVAFGAYESSLYGGNQATAYTEAINTLGEANRELLRGVQERSYDTTLWIEQMKIQQAVNNNAAAAAAATPAPPTADKSRDKGATAHAPPPPGSGSAQADKDDDEDDDVLDEKAMNEFLAVSLANASANDVFEPFSEKLERLVRARRELTNALRWADEVHAHNLKNMPRDKRLELARRVVALFDEQFMLLDTRIELTAKFATPGRTRAEVDAAITADAATSAKLAELDAKHERSEREVAAALAVLAKPNFFDAPNYRKFAEGDYEQLIAKGRQTFADGQEANEVGDAFTLATVFLTIALFFTGLSPILKRYQLKVTFLSLGTVIAIGATIYMFRHPLA